MMRRRALLATPALALAGHARAQGFPDRPLRLIIPWTPGGTNDIVGRIVADAMGPRLGQSIVIENRGGAGGALGAEVVAKAAPDGLTLLLGGSGSLTINHLVRRSIPYDPATAFAPIGMMVEGANVLVVHTSVRATTMRELQAEARARPMTYGSSGVGSTSHAVGAMIALALGVEIEHIPYRGSGPALNDIIAGRLSMMSNAVAPMLPHIRAGSVRAIGIAGGNRSATTPEVPTMAEQGFPEVDAATWYALLATGGTPPDRVARLHAALNGALADPTVRQRLEENGLDIIPSESPDAFAGFLAADTARWAPVIRRAGVTAN
ncbi:tripartite tricarboxylate transporter substrate binding protein [Roseomonas arctica]|uniref:Tripartite tricarboxylate transporter substrate binding protein n=2 Tax=Plastoroseomonas arctica TaxID=1509237 RepID=A0AAF1K5D8_9PROT|nr:tripartite tricarboxylate transporter substrate binding protein [Plastoroseomonas arctica]